MRSPMFHGSNPARSFPPRGMTIAEILAVLGVIALLMSLILPALGSVRRTSRAVACASNMRQIGLAHQMYVRDNRDDFVPAGLSHGSSPGDPRNSWLTKLSRYMDGHSALRSPVDRSPYWAIDDGGDYEGMTLAQALAYLQANPGENLSNEQVSRWSSYGVNVMLTDMFSGYPSPKSGEMMQWTHMHSVPRPSMTVHFLMLTSGDGAGDPKFARSDHLDTNGWVSVPPHKPEMALALAAKQSQMNAHGGRLGSWNAVSNYLFLDGRVETLSFNVVYADSAHNWFLPIATPSK